MTARLTLVLWMLIAAAPVAHAADPRPRVETSPIWVYTDAVIGLSVRHHGDTEAQAAVGGIVEVLFGASHRQPPDLGLRLGPIISATANIGEDVGAQLAAGLTLLVWGEDGKNDEGFGTGLSLSAGLIGDLPPGDDAALGGLARVSIGFTTIGRSRWKPVSAWLYLEAHYIPDSGPGGDRFEGVLGVRANPLAFFFLLVPGAADR